MDHDDSMRQQQHRQQQHQQQHHHHHHHHEHYEPHAALSDCPAEQHLSAAVQSLDTVRALHSTVVSLRSALEEAHREIDQLRKQIRIGETIESGKEFRRSQDNLSTAREAKPEASGAAAEPEEPIRSPKSPSARKSRRLSSSASGRTSQKHGSYSIRLLPEDIRVVRAESSRGAGERRKPMASKIDVQIKVSSNFEVKKDGESSVEERIGDSIGEDVGHSEITSTESDSHVDTEQSDVEIAPKVESASESHIPADDKRTPTSEGDNSVFEEPTDSMEQPEPLTTASALAEQHVNEEVDDIELIFSADEKDFAREDEEDLVSITGDYEPWTKSGKSGTPVLVNFGSIASEKDGTAKGDDADNGEGGIPRDDSYDTFYPLTNSSSFLGGPGLRWTNHNVLIETDISKCGIEETPARLDLSRRNTCPNPPSYRPLIHREAMAAMGHDQQATASRPTISTGRTPLAVKFSRNSRAHPSSFLPRQQRPIIGGVLKDIGNLDKPDSVTGNPDGLGSGAKRQSQSAQTEISALPEHWRSESHLMDGDAVGGQLGTDGGFYTLPSKYVPPEPTSGGHRYNPKSGNETQEARRVLLSDINFTSMVPELSRSADHLCQAENTDPNNANQLATRIPAGESGTDGAEDVDSSKKSSYKESTHLQTPDYAGLHSTSMRGIASSTSGKTTPGLSQWTINNNHNNKNTITATTVQQDTQTSGQHPYYGRHDSTDSGKSGVSLGSRCSVPGIVALHKQSRSRSVPSVAWRCPLYRPIAVGQQQHHLHHQHHIHPPSHPHSPHLHCISLGHSGRGTCCALGGIVQSASGKQPMGLRGSESMHYTPRVTFQEPAYRGTSAASAANSSSSSRVGTNRSAVRGSLPDLRAECPCAAAHRTAMCRSSVRECESSGSTDSLLDEADTLVRSNSGCGLAAGGADCKRSISGGQLSEAVAVLGGAATARRFSENDIKRDYTPSKQSLPFLPKSANCLKLGHLVKVITRNGRVVVGRVRYIGPVAGKEFAANETFVGLQLPSKVGDCDGSIEGRRFFECSAQHGIFVAFKKIVMAWTA